MKRILPVVDEKYLAVLHEGRYKSKKQKISFMFKIKKKIYELLRELTTR